MKRWIYFKRERQTFRTQNIDGVKNGGAQMYCDPNRLLLWCTSATCAPSPPRTSTGPRRTPACRGTWRGGTRTSPSASGSQTGRRARSRTRSPPPAQHREGGSGRGAGGFGGGWVSRCGEAARFSQPIGGGGRWGGESKDAPGDGVELIDDRSRNRFTGGCHFENFRTWSVGRRIDTSISTALGI